MTNKAHNQMRRQVLDAITKGGIKMRPRWHFVLQASLAIIGGIILSLTLIFGASFIVFILHRTGAWFVPGFGPRGWYAFLVSLPWILIFLLVIFVIILEILVHRYAFSYRRPLLLSVLCILILVVGGGFTISTTSFHRAISRSAEHGHLPPLAGRFYRGFGQQRFRAIHRGVITEVTGEGFQIKNRRGEDLTIIVTPATRIPPESTFAPGESVVVFGDRNDHTVRAFGIRIIDRDE